MARVFMIGAASLLVLGVGFTRVGPVRTADLFWHLQVGELLLERGELPAKDPLTFTAGERPWTHHEWGSQLLMVGAARLAGGLWGPRLLRGALVSLTLLLLLLAFRRAGLGPLLALAGLAASWLCLQPHALMRPHLVSWAITALFLWQFLLVPPPWRVGRYLGFGLLQLLWMNLHSGAMLVPALCGLHLVDLGVGAALGRRPGPGQLRHWALLAGGAGVLVLAQPAGPGVLRFALETARINRGWSTEWFPLYSPDVLQGTPEVLVLHGLLVLGVLLLVARWLGWPRLKEREPAAGGAGVYPGLLTAAVVLALAAHTRRMAFLSFLPLMVLLREVQAPLAAGRVVAGLLLRPWLAPLAGLVLALTVVARALPTDGALLDPRHAPADRFPLAAAEFVGQAGLEGRMFNPDWWGGYLSYRLFPGQRTFIDGRAVLMGKGMYDDERRIMLRSGGGEVEQVLGRHRINFLLQPAEFYFRGGVLDRRRYLLAHVDRDAVVLLRRHTPGKDPLFQRNLRRVCAYYAKNPGRRRHARWAFGLASRDGRPTPTQIRPAIDECGSLASVPK